MKKEIYASPVDAPFRLTVTGSDEEVPTKMRLWFVGDDGREQLRVEVSGDHEKVLEIQDYLGGSTLIQKLIKEADPDQKLVAQVLEEAKEAVREAVGGGA